MTSAPVQIKEDKSTSAPIKPPAIEVKEDKATNAPIKPTVWEPQEKVYKLPTDR